MQNQQTTAAETLDVEDVELMFEEIAPTPVPTIVPAAPEPHVAPVSGFGLSLTTLVDQMTTALRARVAEEIASLQAALREAKVDSERCLSTAWAWKSFGEGVRRENHSLKRRIRQLEAQLSVSRGETDALLARVREIKPETETETETQEEGS